MQIDPTMRITRFVEKPKEPAVLDSLRVDRAVQEQLGLDPKEDYLLASMGIYLFNRDVVLKLLDNTHTDFGKHIIPGAISSHKVHAYIFQGYWEDVGTIRSYFEANLDLVADLPRFNFFDMSAPIFTRPRFLPASKINGAEINSRGHFRRLHHQQVNHQSQYCRRAQRHRRRLQFEPHHPPGLRLLRIGSLHSPACGPQPAAHRHRTQYVG